MSNDRIRLHIKAFQRSFEFIAESKSTQNLNLGRKKSENKMAAKTFFLVGAVVLLILQGKAVKFLNAVNGAA